MARFNEQEGMLIAGTVLSHDNAIKVLKMLLETTKDGKSYAAALKQEIEDFYYKYLVSEMRTYTDAVKEDEIKTIYDLYKAWEKIANDWLGIMQTQAMLVSVNEKTSEIQQVYYGPEELFLSNTTSATMAQLSASGHQKTAWFDSTDQQWVPQDKEWRARFTNATRNVLTNHYKMMINSLQNERPDMQELNTALASIPKRQTARRQQLHIAIGTLRKGDKNFTFDEQAFGMTPLTAKYGRYTEMFARHMLRNQEHARIITAENASLFQRQIRKSVREEESPCFLELAMTTNDNDAFTAGGDIIIQTANGQPISIQLKTMNNAIRGGNPVVTSVIANTCQKWIKALSADNIEDQAERLWQIQSTQVFMKKTKKSISDLTTETVETLVRNIIDGKNFTIKK